MCEETQEVPVIVAGSSLDEGEDGVKVKIPVFSVTLDGGSRDGTGFRAFVRMTSSHKLEGTESKGTSSGDLEVG